MAPMNLSDLTPHPDFAATLGFAVALVTGVFVLVVLFVEGMAFEATKDWHKKVVTAIGTVATAAAVIGFLGAVGSGLGAMGVANKAANESFHSSLQATYGATTDASLSTVQKPGSEPVPVHTSRGNELVTFRQAGGNLVAFRPDGTELPRG